MVNQDHLCSVIQYMFWGLANMSPPKNVDAMLTIVNTNSIFLATKDHWRGRLRSRNPQFKLKLTVNILKIRFNQ